MQPPQHKQGGAAIVENIGPAGFCEERGIVGSKSFQRPVEILEEIAAIDQGIDESRPQPQRFIEKFQGALKTSEIA